MKLETVLTVTLTLVTVLAQSSVSVPVAIAAIKPIVTVVMNSCVTELAGDSKELAQAKSELADLIIEKSRLIRADETAVRNLVERNIQKKLAEFKDFFGVAIEPREIKNLIAQKERQAAGISEERAAKEKQARRGEKEAKVVWLIKPLTVHDSFLPTSMLEAPDHVKLIRDGTVVTKITYERRATDPEPGYHLYDFATKNDAYFGKNTGDVEYFKSAKQEIVLSAPWSAEARERTIRVHDVKTGQEVDSIVLADAIPDFKNQNFYLGPKLRTYEKADGTAGVIVAWATGNRMPYKIYDLDLSNKTMRELGEAAGDMKFFPAADRKSIFTVGVGPAEEVTPNETYKAVTLTRWPENTVVYADKMKFAGGSEGLFSTTEVNFESGNDGKFYLGLSLHTSDKIIVGGGSTLGVHDIPKSGTGLGAGSFVHAGTRQFYLPKISHDGHQVIYDIAARTSEDKLVEAASFNDFKGAAELSGLAAYALYETYDDKTKEQLLVMLPFAKTSFNNERFDLKYLQLGHLQGTFDDGASRTLGVFTVENHAMGSILYNFSLVQIYGTGVEGAKK